MKTKLMKKKKSILMKYIALSILILAFTITTGHGAYAGEEYAGYCWPTPFNPNGYFWATIENNSAQTVRCYFKKRTDAGGELVLGHMTWPKPATKGNAILACADYVKRENLDAYSTKYGVGGCDSANKWIEQSGWYIR